MALHPVFYDASGRRRRRFALGVIAFVALVLLSVAVFAVSIGAVPAAPLLPFEPEHPGLHRLPAPHSGVIGRAQRSIDYYGKALFGGPTVGAGKAGAKGASDRHRARPTRGWPSPSTCPGTNRAWRALPGMSNNSTGSFPAGCR
ncbi:hypothetical protein [Sphingomonas aerolata]|uniref:hypothetical protein n=1 Tax=Sphingomonas aerolata TaxID=185951 RepID=UPI002FE19EFE